MDEGNMHVLNNRTNLLHENDYHFTLQNVEEPQLFRDMFDYDHVPKIMFNNRAVPMRMPKDIWITDTTFRDGQQARIPFTVKQVVDLYKLEHKLGRGPTDEELSEHLRITPEELTKWLSAIASTTIGPLDRAIAAGAEPSAPDNAMSGSPAAVVEDRELSYLMREEIKKLPDREKLVLSLYYDEGLTLSEIGEVLGVTESRVSQIHTKSVLHLRARLGAAGLT